MNTHKCLNVALATPESAEVARRIQVICRGTVRILAVGFLAIETFSPLQCEAGSEDNKNQVPVRQIAQAGVDADLASSKAEPDRDVVDPKWDATVQEIGREIIEYRHDFGRVHRSILRLAELNTADSRDLLRRIAVAEVKTVNPNLEQWAANNLLKCDNNEAWMLFASVDPNVLTTALNAVQDQRLDQERMQPLKKCLKHKDSFVRIRAAEVIATAPSGKLAEDAIECLGQFLAAVADIADVDTVKRRHFLGVEQTEAEDIYERLSWALVRTQVSDQALHKLAEQQKGRARDAVILALAQRGDKSVRESVLTLAQDPDAGLFRRSAALALEKVGTTEDLALLKKMAKTDVLVREMQQCIQLGDEKGPYYPVREAAERTIRVLETTLK